MRVGMGAAIVPLLAVSVFINYVDRGNLATAAPLIKDELHLSASAFGVMTSAFFWTYTPCQLLAGWLSERFHPYRILAVGLGLWSLATAATGLVTGFTALLLLRVLLGLGESAAFPCSSKLIAKHLPVHEMGRANAMVLLGTSLGPAFGIFFGGLLMAKVGWRPSFLLFGLGSLLWLLPWWAATRRSPQTLAAEAAADATDPKAPSFAAIMARREAWGAGKWMGFQNCIGNFAGILCPLITGWIVDTTGSFSSAFVLAAAVSLAGIFSWCLVVGKIEPLKWASVEA